MSHGPPDECPDCDTYGEELVTAQTWTRYGCYYEECRVVEWEAEYEYVGKHVISRREED